MTSNDPWDDPDLSQSADYYKFENVGDKASGRITRVGKFKFEGDDRYVPQLTVTDDTTGEATDLTAKQVQLRIKLNDLRPRVGDHIVVTYSRTEGRPGGKTLKHFDVVVNGGVQAAAPAPVAATPAPQPVAAAAPAPAATAPVGDPAAAQAAIAAMDPATRELLGLG